MSKKHKNIVWLFVLALFVAESILIIFATFNFHEKRDHILEDRTSQLKTSYESIFNTYTLVSEVIFHQIINTPQITKLYSRAYNSDIKEQAIIRDSLFLLLNPSYQELNTKAIKQLHFHLPDNRSFLRFHSPSKFGDDLTDIRESVRIANAEKHFVKGFEEGKVFNGFRFVWPLSYGGEHIGTVETSTSFGAISQIMFERSDNLYAMILKKSVTDEKLFEEDKIHYTISTVSDNWVEEVSFLHYKTDHKILTKDILNSIDQEINKDCQGELDEGHSFSKYLTVYKRKFIISFFPLFNLKQEHVAYLISYAPDNVSKEYIDNFQLIIGAGTLILLIITGLFYVVYSKSVTIEKQHGALIESESRYQHIFNTIDIGIIRSSVDGKIILANSKMLDILGYESVNELMIQNVNDIYVNSKIRKKWIADLTTDETIQIDEEVLWNKKDGKKILVKLSGKRHVNALGLPYLESVVQDVTELRALEESLKDSEAGLRQSNAAKDRFFSILAHDLRGPFNSLLGLTEILALTPETIDEERKNRFVHLIFSSMKNLANLIENLLNWSRSQQGTLNYEPKEIELGAVIKETVDLLSEIALAKQIIILPNINNLIKLLADENMVKTIIRNLLSNAIKFTHKEGLIKIYSRDLISVENRNFIEIVIEDNGVGIAKKDLDKLFKIDSGFTNPGTENEKGTGLGLVLIKEFVEKHEGTIVVESEKEIGTKVIFTLPTVS